MPALLIPLAVPEGTVKVWVGHSPVKKISAKLSLGALALLLAASSGAAPPATSPPPAAPPSDAELYDQAKALFDALAPPEIKAQYDFPTRAELEEFVAHLQTALDTGSLASLVAYEDNAKLALAALRTVPEDRDYADWLQARIEEMDVARESLKPPPPPPTIIPPQPGEPPPPPPPRTKVPLYELWAARLRDRPPPARAAALLPAAKTAFASEGVPPALAWLAEAESGFNPLARSPAGARGLYQLMPGTAHDLGLSTFFPDDRTDPAKSAHASAQLLRRLHAKFGTWPLALAAYNTGEGRVSRLLASRHTTTFAGIADALPGETRLYVPKVLAIVNLREGVDLDGPAGP